MGELLRTIIGVGILGSVITMLRFSKYCRLLNQHWTLDPETMERYQAWAKRYLAATGCLLAVAFLGMLLGPLLI